MCSAHPGGTDRRQGRPNTCPSSTTHSSQTLLASRGLERDSLTVRVAGLSQHQRALDSAEHVALLGPRWWRMEASSGEGGDGAEASRKCMQTGPGGSPGHSALPHMVTRSRSAATSGSSMPLAARWSPWCRASGRGPRRHQASRCSTVACAGPWSEG